MMLYLGTLVVSLAGMVVLDRRYRLVLWADARRGAVVLAAGTAFFLVWDVAAIAAGFYRRGDSAAMTGAMLAPELPLEELFFIVFLAYLTLVLHGLVTVAARARARTARTRASARIGEAAR
ncbi:lycopene cyclase domain-containing protein [Georgenia yuyongxinii]|uniref:Lycopene cyclase domain-containing protein n=1 Tax=Georgenia yuyongxinii TaxID=2589797 RepID=A0A552WK35_9MICO|nr:lycopene cyclase domain-containing protein [Georgenia yuyongxinii]TRW43044.1 lycopene cyclase domain-containing protein [Georgenia yuyongxinii]